jgi:antagonist of KipI
VAGGVDGPVILGSRSSLTPLAAGTQLECQPALICRRFIKSEFLWSAEPRCLRFLDGAQSAWFPAGQLEQRTFTVTPSSNRMGLRLQSTPLAVPDRELTSEPVCPGTVQVTRDGQCIVLGVDGQTIGGYPKIAQVIAADIDKLGQLRPGDTVSFRPVSLEQAEAAHAAKAAELKEWLVRLSAIA